MKNKIAVFVSGGGTNLQALIDAEKSGRLQAHITAVISDRKAAFALERGKSAGIESFYYGKGNFPDMEERYGMIQKTLDEKEVDFIVLAGYLGILPASFIEKYENRIINIHPSLLPKYGGSGFYGDFVHLAVLENNEKETGATVHYVTNEIDGGEILIQRSVDICNGETLENMKEKVHKIEHMILVEGVNLLVDRGISK